MVKVHWATLRNMKAIKALAEAHRKELGFVPLPALVEAVKEKRLLIAVNASSIIGFVHFRCCRDGHATVYEIAVAPKWRGKGIGRKLIEAVCAYARECSCTHVRLKCPIDLPANGFYARLGFARVGIERDKKTKQGTQNRQRPLAIWELDLSRPTPDSSSGSSTSSSRWQFFVGLTSDASQIRALVRRFFEGYHCQPPFNPFERIIVSPLFVQNSTLRLLKSWREGDSSLLHSPFPVPHPVSIMFDSGGYQVQIGRLTYGELCRRLRETYALQTWADLYVLPDHVPSSRDTDTEVEHKVKETLVMGELFLRWLNNSSGLDVLSPEKVVGVVHGRNIAQIRYGIKKWHELGVSYVAFGSFGASGPKGSVNMLSQRSLLLLRALQEEARSLGMRFHIFGIGSPSYLVRLSESGIAPTSFDSSGWWKAGGFGNLLFVNAPQLHFARYSKSMKIVSTQKVCELKVRLGHECPFCSNLLAIKQSRYCRILHNLVTFGEALQQILDGGGRAN